MNDVGDPMAEGRAPAWSVPSARVLAGAPPVPLGREPPAPRVPTAPTFVRVPPAPRARSAHAPLTNSVRAARALSAFCPAHARNFVPCAARALEHALPHRAYLRTLDCAPPTQFPSAASRGGERASKAGAGEQEHFDSCSRARANCTPPSVASVLRYFNSRLRMRGNWKYAFPVVAI